MLCLCIMYMVSSWHFRSCLGSAWRGEEGQPHQFLVRASSKFSSFSLIEMLFWRTSFIGYIHYFTNLKIVWENFVFYFCAEVAIFSKNIFICKGWTLKKNNIGRTRISRWHGRENEENAARTRYCCGWSSSSLLTPSAWKI